MASRQLPWLRVVALVVLAKGAPPCTAQAPMDYGQLVSAAASRPFGADRCQQLAVEFGDWVVRQRDSDPGRDGLPDGRKLGEQLHGACRAAIRDLERATNEDEIALETLYRSELWYEVNRALAALRYWQAWLDLSLAQQSAEENTRVTALSRAERGFQAASLRILYPGLVYGSWLGLAYVAQLRDDTATMKQRLTLLQRALQDDPDNPLRETVETELQLLALRTRPVEPIPLVREEPLTEATARLAEAQAFVLLARQREQGSGASQAAQYLRQLIDQGFLDDRLFARILYYRDEITGHDIGPLGLLVDAEFAYGYQQYETTVLKFRRFLATDAVNLPLNLKPFYYHYAVALYQIGLNRDAMTIVEQLGDSGRMAAELQTSVTKLRFIIAEAMYQGDPSPGHATAMRRAAEAFIATAPTDPDIASVHLAMARVTDDSALRKQHLEQASADSGLEDNVRAVELELALARFQEAIASGQAGSAVESAAVAMELVQALPGSQRESPDVQVLVVQLNSVLAEAAEETLQLIDSLDDNPALNPSQKRVLLWSRLRLIDRLQGMAALAEYVRGLPATGADQAVNHELYVLLREFESRGRSADVAQLSQLWLPRLGAEPQLQRQVWLLQIAALREAGQDAAALEAIRAMLASFPRSGDAWEQLAQQSEHMGDAFAAERAWAHIAAAEPEGSDRWLDVSLHRLALLAAGESSVGRGCSLAQRIGVYDHRLQQSQRALLAEVSRAMSCPGQQEQ